MRNCAIGLTSGMWFALWSSRRLLPFDPGSMPIVNAGSGQATSISRIAALVLESWPAPAAVVFNGKSRPGDPFSLVADSRQLRNMGFEWSVPVTSGICDYVQWYLQYSRSDLRYLSSPVFMLMSGRNWAGTGLYNYFVNLAHVLAEHARDRVQPIVVFVGTDVIAANVAPFAAIPGVIQFVLPSLMSCGSERAYARSATHRL